MSDAWATFLAALAGGAITGAIAIVTLILTNRRERERLRAQRVQEWAEKRFDHRLRVYSDVVDAQENLIGDILKVEEMWRPDDDPDAGDDFLNASVGRLWVATTRARFVAGKTLNEQLEANFERMAELRRHPNKAGSWDSINSSRSRLIAAIRDDLWADGPKADETPGDQPGVEPTDTPSAGI